MGLSGFLPNPFDRWSGADGLGSGPDRRIEPDSSVDRTTGLPMLDGGVDVMGNPLGINLHRHDHHHHDGFDDRWGGSSSSSLHDTSSSWPDHFSSSYDPPLANALNDPHPIPVRRALTALTIG